MTTRNNMRRELQDLAKLADSMPKERPTPPPAQAAPAPARPSSPMLARPLTPSRISVTIPPTVASVPPPTFASPTAQPRRSGRGALIAVALAGLVVAIAGGGVLGKTLAHRASAPAAAAA